MGSFNLADHSFIKGMDLTPKELSVISDISEPISVDPDSAIFHESDKSDAMYLSTSSPVKITALITQKLEKLLYTVAPDSVFGEMALLDDAPRSASARPIDPTEIIKMDRDKFLAILNKDSNLGLKLMRGLYVVVTERLRSMDAAYAQNIRWGLEVSGATKLDFSELISGDTPVEFAFSGGERLKGRIVKVVETPHDLELTVCTNDKIYIIPYSSVNFVTFATDEKFLEEE